MLLLLAHNNSSGYAIDGILLGVCGILRSLIAPCIRGLSGKAPQEDPVSWRTSPLRRYSRLILNSLFKRREHTREGWEAQRQLSTKCHSMFERVPSRLSLKRHTIMQKRFRPQKKNLHIPCRLSDYKSFIRAIISASLIGTPTGFSLGSKSVGCLLSISIAD